MGRRPLRLRKRRRQPVRPPRRLPRRPLRQRPRKRPPLRQQPQRRLKAPLRRRPSQRQSYPPRLGQQQPPLRGWSACLPQAYLQMEQVRRIVLNVLVAIGGGLAIRTQVFARALADDKYAIS